MRREDGETMRDLFFCPLTLHYEVLCPFGPDWGCPHATAATDAPGQHAAFDTRSAGEGPRPASPPRRLASAAGPLP